MKKPLAKKGTAAKAALSVFAKTHRAIIRIGILPVRGREGKIAEVNTRAATECAATGLHANEVKDPYAVTDQCVAIAPRVNAAKDLCAATGLPEVTERVAIDPHVETDPCVAIAPRVNEAKDLHAATERAAIDLRVEIDPYVEKDQHEAEIALTEDAEMIVNANPAANVAASE